MSRLEEVLGRCLEDREKSLKRSKVSRSAGGGGGTWTEERDVAPCKELGPWELVSS